MNDNSTLQKNSIHFKPSVAVVILNWNGKQFLEKFLPSVLLSTYTNLNIIVADNASTDDSVIFVKQHFPLVQIIENHENGGFAKGYNMALKTVDADFFVLLNSDVEVTTNWIEPIIELMESDLDIAACQPKILDYNRKTHFEYAGASGGFIDKYGYPFARGRIFEEIEADNGQYNDAVPCFWASGACMLVRANVFKKLGGFDEYFFAHQEEIDLCWRMQLNGYKIFVQPESVVYHVGGGTLPKGNNKKVYLNFRNNLIMLYKNYSIKDKLTKIPIRLILDGVAAFKGLLEGNGGYLIAVLNAHIGFYRWIFFYKQKTTQFQEHKKNIIGMYNINLVWNYFVKKKNKFSKINLYK